MSEKQVQELLMRMCLGIKVKKVTEIEAMINYGITMIPALVINEEVNSTRIIPKDEDIIKW